MTRPALAALAALALGTGAAAGIAVLTWPRLFDSTPPGVGQLVSATCATPDGAACGVEAITLGPGRHWLEASAQAAGQLTLEVELRPAERPALLMLGASADGYGVEVHESRDGTPPWRSVATREDGGGPRRRLVHLDPDRGTGRLRVTLARPDGAGAGERLRVEEVGLFSSEAGLVADTRPILAGLPDRRVYNRILARACLWLAALGIVAAAFLPRERSALPAAAFVFCLTLAATLLMLYVVHNPYWYRARDLRVMLASGPLQDGVGANLNYGMYLGSRLLAGEGMTFGPGFVPWERMPGYGFFGALSGLTAGFTTDLLAIGMTSIQLHLLLFAAANALFAAAATRVMRPALALLSAVLVCFMPNQLANTQADSIMVALYLLTAAALCVYLDRERREGFPPFRFHLLVHAPFALWFLTRPEGVVGWAAVSLILYRRRLLYLALPAALYLSIGVSWALYKGQYTGEFSMTTNTVGDNAWIGLWQVPSQFRWQTKDESYFEWAAAVDVPPTSKRASDTALSEVARFALTYPVYVSHLALHRLRRFADVNSFNGIVNYPQLDYERLRGPAVWALAAVVALCLALGHESSRTLLLGWPLFFNLPLFLLFFSDDMRHVAPCTAALLVTAVPPLAEPGLHRALLRRKARALAVVLAFALAWPLTHWADQAILASDTLRYWTPFLDPAPFAWYLR